MENKRKALGKGLEQLFNSEPLNMDTLNNYEMTHEGKINVQRTNHQK